MREGKTFLASLLFLSVLMAEPAHSQDSLVLENEELRVVLSPNGTLQGVYKKPSNISHLGSSKQAGWFRIQIPLPYWEGHGAASDDLKAVTVRRHNPGSVELQTAELLSKEGRYALRTILTLRLERDNLVCKLSLQNQTNQTIDRIVFPVLDVPAAADSKELLAMPHSSLALRNAFSDNQVRTYHSPMDTMNLLDGNAWFFSDPKISAKAFNYPDTLPTAWIMFAGDGKGIGIDSRDRQFQYQKFIVERRLHRDSAAREANQLDYELSWSWFPLVPPGNSWESPEVYIKFDQGDWHAIASQHRNWLKGWIRRPDVAGKLKSSIGWVSRRLRSYDEIPDIAAQGVNVGAPYFIVYGWAQASAAEMTYGGQPRVDLGGLPALKRNLVKARELGSHPLAWFNGTLSGDTRLEHLTMGNRWMALDRWGAGIPDGQWSLFGAVQPATVPNNEVWPQLDPSGSKDFLVDTIRRYIEGYGFSGFEMDQGYKYFLSYREAAQNAHPGLAYARGYTDFYNRVTEIVKKGDPDGIIVGEGYSDFMNQFVDSSWVFQGGALDVAKQSRLRYSLPWITVPTRAVVQNRGHANQAFMMNAPLDIFDDLTPHPEYAKHLERLHGLKKLTTHYFFDGEFADEEGFSFQPAVSREIAAKSYRDPGGKFLAVVVVNTTGTPQAMTLVPGVSPTSTIRHYWLDGRTEVLGPAPKIGLELAAFDVQILVFESR